jgi:hypothetical protein
MQPELQETRVLLPPPVTPSDEEPIAAGGRQLYEGCGPP